jgi:hypothetical protein
MKRSSFSTALYVSLVFLSGAAVGGFSYRLYTMKTVLASPVVSPKPDDYRTKYLDEMRTRLSLSPEQLKQLSVILDSTKSRYHEVKAKWDKEAKLKAKPELRAIQEDQVQKIKGMLSDPQRIEYDKLRVERDKRRSANKASSTSGN